VVRVKSAPQSAVKMETRGKKKKEEVPAEEPAASTAVKIETKGRKKQRKDPSLPISPATASTVSSARGRKKQEKDPPSPVSPTTMSTASSTKSRKKQRKDSPSSISPATPSTASSSTRRRVKTPEIDWKNRDEVRAFLYKRKKILDNSLEGLVEYIKEGRAKKIVVLAGAGISVSCGLPDFRTPGTGLYDNLQKYNLRRPEDIFSLNFFRHSPNAFNELAKELVPGDIRPSSTHFFMRLLETKGLLLRLYTQNIDTLEMVARVSEEKIISAHGGFKDAHCIDCGKRQPLRVWKDTLDRNEIPRCQDARCDGLVKPDIVFFGESLPDAFFENYQRDLSEADLVITFGTSLSVAPFKFLPTLCDDLCPRVLINRQKVGTIRRTSKVSQRSSSSSNSSSSSDDSCSLGEKGFRFDLEDNYRDVYLEGDCDDIVDQLVDGLDWRDDFEVVKSAVLESEDHFQKLINQQRFEE